MKPWYQSKTVWFNLVSILIGVAALLAGGDYGADVARIAGFVFAVGNLVLRYFFTDTSIQR